ncbi:hypothetical protein [Pseudomonas aeruginosa]|uniref:hypothetical protein n=1 Tax=Pseudomonas aeruginosa TaxID=287 RepID=UPI000F52062A|nr:hypothetical protein [Pseudomonas aeruginosa]MDU0606248.1 hypothetical protein [Pseudomonas aeruginosa]HDQ4554781.1 hypothetical protein [Pseudomonas aeruginosa]
MSRRINSASFRKDLASDLRAFASVLDRKISATFSDIGALTQAANMCAANMPYGKDSWGYSVDNLVLRIRTPRKTIPSTVGEYLKVKVDYKVAGMCSANFSELVAELEFNIVVSTEDNQLLSSWHFDRHITSEGDGDPDDAHPLYHFQYGGRNLAMLDGNHGGILIMPSPRIGHPPMDIILGLDFVLSNFAGGQWKLLRGEGEYGNKVRASQERYLRPYIEGLHTWFGSSARSGFSELLWPHLI